MKILINVLVILVCLILLGLSIYNYWLSDKVAGTVLLFLFLVAAGCYVVALLCSGDDISNLYY